MIIKNKTELNGIENRSGDLKESEIKPVFHVRCARKGIVSAFVNIVDWLIDWWLTDCYAAYSLGAATLHKLFVNSFRQNKS